MDFLEVISLSVVFFYQLFNKVRVKIKVGDRVEIYNWEH
jgi:hypothetical protein